MNVINFFFHNYCQLILHLRGVVTSLGLYYSIVLLLLGVCLNIEYVAFFERLGGLMHSQMPKIPM